MMTIARIGDAAMQDAPAQASPFPCRKPDGYFFTTPALRLRLDLIRDYVRRGGSPVLVLGESGAGKSALLNQLVRRADHNWRVVRIPAVPSFSAADVTRFLGAELRLPTRHGPEAILESLRASLERLAIRGQTVLVVVDDADDLDNDALGRLATLREAAGRRNLCVLMTGVPRLRPRLNTLLGPASTAGAIPTVSVPCLDRREVASYIDMRLYHAGIEGKGPFDRATIADIARGSGGHPGRINAMANEVLAGAVHGARLERVRHGIARAVREWLTPTA